MSFTDAIRGLRDGDSDSSPPPDPPHPPDSEARGEPAAEAPLSVTEVCRRVNDALLGIEGGPEIRVEGEIGSCSLPGHWYFTLKDEHGSQLSCAFFSPRYRADSETPTPRVGMKVIAHGRPEMYAKGGRLSFIASRLREAGLGDLHQRFERLKSDLRDRGWFDPGLRVELPPFARRIMVITSGDGAARRDVEETARRLWPGLQLLLVAVACQRRERVQGHRRRRRGPGFVRTHAEPHPTISAATEARCTGTLPCARGTNAARRRCNKRE